MRPVLPLHAFPIAETTNADDAQRILSRELMDVRITRADQLERFRLSMNGVRLGHTLVAFNQFATDTTIDAGWVEDTVAVIIGDNIPSVIHLDGEAVVATPGKAAIVSPARRMVIERTAHAGAYAIRVPAGVIENRLHELTDRHVGKPIMFDRSVDLSTGPSAQLARMLRFVLSEVQRESVHTANRVLYAAFDDMLLSAMLLLPNNYSQALEQTRQQAVASPLIRRAEAYLEAHAHEAVTLSDLVAVCQCSRASLFKGFRSVRGYTPMQFLAERRLQNAREKLMDSHADETITSIVYGCGFSHLGRFSQAYRQRFGEHPSDTRRQTKKRLVNVMRGKSVKTA